MKADRSGEDGEYRHSAGSGSQQQVNVSILQICIDTHRLLDLENRIAFAAFRSIVFVVFVAEAQENGIYKKKR